MSPTARKYLFIGLALLVLAFVLSFFVNRQNRSVESYAETFCRCAAQFAPAEKQFRIGKLSERNYMIAREEHRECLGKNDPFAERRSSSDSLAFLRDFTHAIRLECPEVAQAVGFRID